MSFFSMISGWGRSTITSSSDKLRSCRCTQAQLQSPVFQAWVTRMGEQSMRMHRKLWEYCFIAQALYERGMLVPGSRGLGFGVGQEPLTALFASLGCEIVATDLATEEAYEHRWVETSQHADSLEALNSRGICSPEIFPERVSFRFVDMRKLPDDFGTFDFVWSSCSLEHLGTMALGEEFIFQSLKYLKPGGSKCSYDRISMFDRTFLLLPRGRLSFFGGETSRELPPGCVGMAIALTWTSERRFTL